jgi:phosphoribosylanthranilate isomerase
VRRCPNLLRQGAAFSISGVRRTRIKFCGIGHVEDALAAARAGADAIGLIFYPAAPRNIALARAAEILAALPPFITPVGLFVDADAARIRETARGLNLRHIQLHGHEPPELVGELREFTILKAVRVQPEQFAAELEMWRQAIIKQRLSHLQGLVLETAGAAGGNGKANDWQAVRHHRQRGDLVGLPALIAAGGLTVESVGAVVRDLRPWAVDVSSGVESSPGRKSADKMASFIHAVRDAERE